VGKWALVLVAFVPFLTRHVIAQCDPPCDKGFFCAQAGTCEPCTCEGKECGHDGCNNPCGTCPKGLACMVKEQRCVEPPSECVPKDTPGCPNCGCEACVCAELELCCVTEWDKFCVLECGDLCGGPDCRRYCFPECDGKVCGEDGCGGECGHCKEGEYCLNGLACVLCSCEGKECGDDGCGNTCGTCGEGFDCNMGKCVPVGCAPRETGGCDGCPCESDVCKILPACCSISWTSSCAELCQSFAPSYCLCVPKCSGKMCGDDGCGGKCPPGCKESEFCDGQGICRACSCEGKECGDDGCGGSCGTCDEGWFCTNDGKCLPEYPLSCLGLTSPSAMSCPEGLAEVGCCDSQGRVVFCKDQRLYCIDCKSLGLSCGYTYQGQFYDCGDFVYDPFAPSPYECTFSQCIPNCEKVECGDGGCPAKPDACGKCREGYACVNGRCEIDKCSGVTFFGCCDGQKVIYCKNNEVFIEDCSLNQPPYDTCGFTSQYYDCGGKGENPNHPISCPEICVPNCDGKECGNGGCQNYPSDLCGTCGVNESCIEGKCQTKQAEEVLEAHQEEALIVEEQDEFFSITEEAVRDVSDKDVSELATVPSPEEKGSSACSTSIRSSKSSLLLAFTFVFFILGLKKRRSILQKP